MKISTLRIEKLDPMRVASARAFSEHPERDAWRVLRAWAERRGLLADPLRHPVFGFNNPPPVNSRKKYGYEFWIGVDRASLQEEGTVEVKDFEGGLYAVATCRLVDDPAGSLPAVWQRLWQSVQSGPYRWRATHELERPHDPLALEEDMILDLYLPIEARDEVSDHPL